MLNVPTSVTTAAVYVLLASTHVGGADLNEVVRGDEPSGFGQPAPATAATLVVVDGRAVVAVVVTFLFEPPPVVNTASTRTIRPAMTTRAMTWRRRAWRRRAASSAAWRARRPSFLRRRL